jgi:hypothetical protein
VYRQSVVCDENGKSVGFRGLNDTSEGRERPRQASSLTYEVNRNENESP